MWSQHHRFRIWNMNQHPLVHNPSEFPYANPALPPGNVVNMQQAFDWLFAVLYPQTKAAVATVADLPAVGNTLNDYRVVQDDGDGKSAGYRWEQREGEAVPSWHKILDIDWGADSVLQAWQQRTQYMFAIKLGYDDLDASGAALTGIQQGQHIFGGATAGGNLSLYANSGDGAGAPTGFVQFGNNVRPMADATFSLGTTALRWLKVWTDTLTAGTMTIGAGSIIDSSNAITFGASVLSTSATVKPGTMTLGSGSITDSSGSISFGAVNLLTTGTLGAGTTTVGDLTANKITATVAASTLKSGSAIGHLTLSDGSIVDSSGSISFGAMNLLTSGTLGAGASTLSSATIGTTTITGSTVSTNAGDLVLNSAGGTVTVSAATLAAALVTGTSFAAGAATSTVYAKNAITADASTDLTLTTRGLILALNTNVRPTFDASIDLGTSGKRFEDLYLAGAINNDVDAISMNTLISLRDINVGVGVNFTLFWNGTKWVASAPDTEITHSSLSGLTTGDAGHTQFVMLDGRAGGQTTSGGTAASENLALQSTAHATKGFVTTDSILKPTSDGLLDLGAAGARFLTLYLKGEAIGLRIENYSTAGAPAASAGTKGRLYYDTTTDDVFVDRGGAWNKLSIERSQKVDTTGWDGVATAVTYDVSADFTDAKKGVWQLQKNSNDNEIIGCVITFPSATQVTVTVDIPLAAGTYTLVGIG